KLTNISTPLVFGPVITGVEPSGFSNWGTDSETFLSTPGEVVIRGSGFGSEVGLSQIRYAGWELSNAVLSWSDDKIVLDTAQAWGSYRTVDFEDLRFSFTSTSGTAASDVGGIVFSGLTANDCPVDDGYAQGWVNV